MDGLLLVDKPSGWTSFDVVAKVRGTLRQVTSNELRVMSEAQKLTTHNSQLKTLSPKLKVGHTGTLDPLATGLLVLTLGTYCKRAQEFSKLDKTYEVTMKLGQTSTTGDAEGELSIPNYSKYSTLSHKIFNALTERLPEVFRQFTGEIMQTPPAFSAIKVNGQRAYKLARAGKEVKLEPRKVTVYSIDFADYDYPLVKFTARVSSGTYIRSLVEDIGKKLGTGAYMSGLRRTEVGSFHIDNAVVMADINPEAIHERLIPVPEKTLDS